MPFDIAAVGRLDSQLARFFAELQSAVEKFDRLEPSLPNAGAAGPPAGQIPASRRAAGTQGTGQDMTDLADDFVAPDGRKRDTDLLQQQIHTAVMRLLNEGVKLKNPEALTGTATFAE